MEALGALVALVPGLCALRLEFEMLVSKARATLFIELPRPAYDLAQALAYARSLALPESVVARIASYADSSYTVELVLPLCGE